MIARSLGLLCVSVLLSGCFGSFDEIWPVKSGERVTALSEGDYTCTLYDNGIRKSSVITITSTSDGANLYYLFEEEDAPTNYGSYHLINPDMYLLASTKEGGSEIIYTYVLINDGHAVLVTPTVEQRNEYATKHGILMDEYGMLDRNQPVKQRRDFIIDLGKNLDKAITFGDCAPK